MISNFDKSNVANTALHNLVPGGSHTYAKSDDQFPKDMAPIISHGQGSRVWDIDGNEYIEYGSGMRSVTLGHAFNKVIDAVKHELDHGSNFIRPSVRELECAEKFLKFVPKAEMVKFCKDGSDATSGAIRLARAYTGRCKIAICSNHPFFSVDDWFIGSTAMPRGIPQEIRDLTLKFNYDDREDLESLFTENPDEIAAIILEGEKYGPPQEGYFDFLREICDRNGTLLVLDEMITGFRWSNGGAQEFHNIRPDLSTFGKAMANGFSVSALAGRKDIMKLGGIKHDQERVWLLSTTHGAESHGLVAAIATMDFYRENPVVDTLWKRGESLANGLKAAAEEQGVAEFVPIIGRPCCLVYGSRDEQKNPSQQFRTLLIQELLKRSILASSLVISYSHTEDDIAQTIEAFSGAFAIYRRALDEGIGKYLHGRPVQPAIRPYA